MTYCVGDTIQCAVHFPDDLAIISFEGRTPLGGTRTLYFGPDQEIARTDVGEYHCNVTLTIDGTWYFRWLGQSTERTMSGESFLEVQKMEAKCKPE